MALRFFITGTDTEVGKTYISLGLLKAYQQLGYKTLGIKPLASGCEFKQQTLINADAHALQQASSQKMGYDLVNPIRFREPIAPNIAAKKNNMKLQVVRIAQQLKPALTSPADITLVEGVGGWHVPLNNTETMADLVSRCRLPVILIIAIRLGCMNHALLTQQAILQSGCRLVGWVANCLHPEVAEQHAMIKTLKTWLTPPQLGVVGYKQKAELGGKK